VATLRKCGWKVLEGRVFNDALLFKSVQPEEGVVVAVEIRKARGDPRERAGVEVAATDQQQARICERRDRKGGPPIRPGGPAQVEPPAGAADDPLRSVAEVVAALRAADVTARDPGADVAAGPARAAVDRPGRSANPERTRPAP